MKDEEIQEYIDEGDISGLKFDLALEYFSESYQCASDFTDYLEEWLEISRKHNLEGRFCGVCQRDKVKLGTCRCADISS
jgi:hypothetical protein